MLSTSKATANIARRIFKQTATKFRDIKTAGPRCPRMHCSVFNCLAVFWPCAKLEKGLASLGVPRLIEHLQSACFAGYHKRDCILFVNIENLH